MSMNNEVIKTLTPREYLSTFLSKDLRLDKRGIKDRRNFAYQFGVLEQYRYSASCLLGTGNKIIAVLKQEGVKEKPNGDLRVNVENFSDSSAGPKTKYSAFNTLNFIKKLVQGNVVVEGNAGFTLHITIINYDGNINDCIAHLILNFFSELEKLPKEISLTQHFDTATYCIVDEKLISDPTANEANASSYYFSLLRVGSKFLVHKIDGELIRVEQLEEAFARKTSE